jgi:hypothetical protein
MFLHAVGAPDVPDFDRVGDAVPRLPDIVDAVAPAPFRLRRVHGEPR